MASGPITSWQIDGENVETVTDSFSWASNLLQIVTAATKLEDVYSLGERLWQNHTAYWKAKHHFVNKGPFSQSCGFSTSDVWMWQLDHKKGWMPKNWCLWTVVLEKTLENSLDCKEIKPVNPKRNQSSIFTGRTDGRSWSSNTLATWCEEPTH